VSNITPVVFFIAYNLKCEKKDVIIEIIKNTKKARIILLLRNRAAS